MHVPLAYLECENPRTQAISLTTSPSRSPSLPPPAAPPPLPPPSRNSEESSMRANSPASRKSSTSPAQQSESAQEGINLSPNSKDYEARKISCDISSK
ncbi:Hypothetical predicted protein [Cloeon dipterum]|uniref:Uncharacterized protein n=1 Tax=Cloeon dipterum TaxID=197152 RepID=A0A8S1DYG5_9INSE|nr:Hypothetical predicted protein [Cloeon dipterum]